MTSKWSTRAHLTASIGYRSISRDIVFGSGNASTDDLEEDTLRRVEHLDGTIDYRNACTIHPDGRIEYDQYSRRMADRLLADTLDTPQRRRDLVNFKICKLIP